MFKGGKEERVDFPGLERGLLLLPRSERGVTDQDVVIGLMTLGRTPPCKSAFFVETKGLGRRNDSPPATYIVEFAPPS